MAIMYLTKVAVMSHRSGREIGEVEITPEMVAAGKEVIASVWLDFTSDDRGPQLWDEVLGAVFLAMCRARSQSLPKF